MTVQQFGDTDEGRTDVADLIAAVTVAVPGVVALHPGRRGEVATYLPGRRVVGVRLGPDVVEVHISVTYGASVLDTAHLVHAAVADIAPSPVEVTVEDIVGHEADHA